jgi:hypothetical protein
MTQKEIKKCYQCKRKLSTLRFSRDYQKKDGLCSICRECKRKQQTTSYSKNKRKISKFSKKYYIKYKERYLTRYKEKYKDTMRTIFSLLGNKCNRCGQSDKRVLQIDHVNGGGSRERKLKGSTYIYYDDIITSIKENEGSFQLLCSNCNLIEAINKGYRVSIWKK